MNHKIVVASQPAPRADSFRFHAQTASQSAASGVHRSFHHKENHYRDALKFVQPLQR
jgi:hypothetical protein